MATFLLVDSPKLLDGTTTKLSTGGLEVDENYNHQLDYVFYRFESTIAGQFFGHTHKDSFRIFFDEQNITRATRLVLYHKL